MPSQYFPLTYTTFWLEHALWGLDPLGYHVVNIVLHIINALLVWVILNRLAIHEAWLAAAIFALHPVHVESVAWVTERKNLLSCLFYLMAILAWLRFTDIATSRPLKYYVLTLFLFTLALLSKTTACTLPATLLIIGWYKDGRLNIRQVFYVLPLVALGLMMGLLTIWWERQLIGTRGEEFAFTIMEKILIAGRAIYFYPAKLVWPTNLMFSYQRWNINPGDAMQYIWLIVSLFVAVLIWIMRRQLGRAPVAAVLFYTSNIAPMLGFISLYTFRYTFVADHYQYVASIALIAMFAAAVNKVHEVSGNWARFVFVPIIFILLGTLTWRQAHIYKDEEALWTDTLKKNPSSWMAHNNLANFLNNQGRLIEALQHHTESLRLNPKSSSAYNDRGITNSALGNYRIAIEDFDKAIGLKPNNARYYYNRGLTYYNLGEYIRAVADLNRTVELNPKYAEAYYILALAYSKAGYAEQAKLNYNKATILGLNQNVYRTFPTFTQ